MATYSYKELSTFTSMSLFFQIHSHNTSFSNNFKPCRQRNGKELISYGCCQVSFTQIMLTYDKEQIQTSVGYSCFLQSTISDKWQTEHNEWLKKHQWNNCYITSLKKSSQATISGYGTLWKCLTLQTSRLILPFKHIQ